MPAIDWISLASPADWEAALVTLQQAATQAKAGTTADRQAVEHELANFWLVPCPFTKKIERARSLYNELVLLDLGQLINRAGSPPLRPAAVPPPARTLGPHDTQLSQRLHQALATLQAQHREHLAAQVALGQQLSELQALLQQLLPPPPARRRRKPPRQAPPTE